MSDGDTFWEDALELAATADTETISTREDFAAITRMGWSGCMHDSDCACTPEMQREDDVILERYVKEKKRP